MTPDSAPDSTQELDHVTSCGAVGHRYVHSRARGGGHAFCRGLTCTLDADMLELTPAELARHDGSDASVPTYVAIKGVIYDVSAKREVYGPGGSYHVFAGKDASKVRLLPWLLLFCRYVKLMQSGLQCRHSDPARSSWRIASATTRSSPRSSSRFWTTGSSSFPPGIRLSATSRFRDQLYIGTRE